jgi:hypothetical protein
MGVLLAQVDRSLISSDAFAKGLGNGVAGHATLAGLLDPSQMLFAGILLKLLQ